MQLFQQQNNTIFGSPGFDIITLCFRRLYYTIHYGSCMHALAHYKSTLTCYIILLASFLHLPLLISTKHAEKKGETLTSSPFSVLPSGKMQHDHPK